MDWRRKRQIEGQQLMQRADICPSRANQIIMLGDRLYHAFDEIGREIGAYHTYEEALRGMVNS
jgi:hypothetical protein